MSRKLVKFLIMFDNSNLLFFPGQFLTGRVILEVDEDMPVLGKKSSISYISLKKSQKIRAYVQLSEKYKRFSPKSTFFQPRAPPNFDITNTCMEGCVEGTLDFGPMKSLARDSKNPGSHGTRVWRVFLLEDPGLRSGS